MSDNNCYVPPYICEFGACLKPVDWKERYPFAFKIILKSNLILSRKKNNPLIQILGDFTTKFESNISENPDFKALKSEVQYFTYYHTEGTYLTKALSNLVELVRTSPPNPTFDTLISLKVSVPRAFYTGYLKEKFNDIFIRTGNEFEMQIIKDKDIHYHQPAIFVFDLPPYFNMGDASELASNVLKPYGKILMYSTDRSDETHVKYFESNQEFYVLLNADKEILPSVSDIIFDQKFTFQNKTINSLSSEEWTIPTYVLHYRPTKEAVKPMIEVKKESP